MSQLPAHLQRLAGLASPATDIIGGIEAGGHPRISYRGMRFRLKEPNGEEVLVQNPFLDVIIVDANATTSRVFYGKGYNPNDEATPPDCFSDNGVGPSAQARAPQCGTCAICPHAAYGSKVSENGQVGFACANSKKLAVVLANNPTGTLYEIRVPGASLKDFKSAMKQWVDAGIPIQGVVFRITFDPTVEYPKLVFTATGYIDENQSNAVLPRIGSPEAIEATGKDDVPRGAAQPALPAPAAAPALPPPPPAHVAAMAPVPTPAAVHAPAPAAPAFVPAPAPVAPAPAAFAPPGTVAAPPQTFAGPGTFTPPGAPVAAPAEKKPRKPRTPKAPAVDVPVLPGFVPGQAQAFTPPTQPLGASPSSIAPPAPAPSVTGTVAVAGVVAAPPATSPDLDAMLNGVFSS